MTWVTRLSEELIAMAAWAVTSADKAYALLREQGYDVRRADVRAAWKDYNEKTLYEGPISQWDPSRKIPKAWIGERETVEAEGYAHIFKLRFWDPVSEEEKESTWSVVLDEPVPFSDVMADVESDLELYAEESGWTAIGYRPTGIMHMTPKG